MSKISAVAHGMIDGDSFIKYQESIMAIKKTVIRLPEYRFEARIDRWVDGDTAEFTVFLGSRLLPIDLGFGVTHVIADLFFGTFRLFALNAPEKYKPGGAEATAFAMGLAPEGSIVEIVSSRDPDNFGRYIAEMYLPGGDTFSSTMIAAGHAVIYTERGSKPS